MERVDLPLFREALEVLVSTGVVNNYLGKVLLDVLNYKAIFMQLDKPNDTLIKNDIADEVVSEVVIVMLLKLPTVKFDMERSDKELLKYFMTSCEYALKTEKRKIFRANSRVHREPLGKFYDLSEGVFEDMPYFEQDLDLAMDMASNVRVNGEPIEYDDLILI